MPPAPRVWVAAMAASLIASGAGAQGIPTSPPRFTTEPLAPPPGGQNQPFTAPPGASAPGQPAYAPPTAPRQPRLANPEVTPPDSAAAPNALTPGAAPQPDTAPPDTGQLDTGQPDGAQPGTEGAVPPPPPASTTPPPKYAPAPSVPAVWLAQGSAMLQVLDKVDAQSSIVAIKAGGSAQYGPLTIAVRACDVSTPNEKPDATAFLDITDSHPDLPSFHGWILKSDPSVSMLQHPIYDVRVLGCRP
jgi:hypothetical protein